MRKTSTALLGEKTQASSPAARTHLRRKRTAKRNQKLGIPWYSKKKHLTCNQGNIAHVINKLRQPYLHRC